MRQHAAPVRKKSFVQEKIKKKNNLTRERQPRSNLKMQHPATTTSIAYQVEGETRRLTARAIMGRGTTKLVFSNRTRATEISNLSPTLIVPTAQRKKVGSSDWAVAITPGNELAYYGSDLDTANKITSELNSWLTDVTRARRRAYYDRCKVLHFFPDADATLVRIDNPGTPRHGAFRMVRDDDMPNVSLRVGESGVYVLKGAMNVPIKRGEFFGIRCALFTTDYAKVFCVGEHYFDAESGEPMHPLMIPRPVIMASRARGCVLKIRFSKSDYELRPLADGEDIEPMRAWFTDAEKIAREAPSSWARREASRASHRIVREVDRVAGRYKQPRVYPSGRVPRHVSGKSYECDLPIVCEDYASLFPSAAVSSSIAADGPLSTAEVYAREKEVEESSLKSILEREARAYVPKIVGGARRGPSSEVYFASGTVLSVDTKECTIDIARTGTRSGEELTLPDAIRIEKEIGASGLILSSQHWLLAELDNMCKEAGLCRTCKCRAPRKPSHGHHLCLCESSASIEDLAGGAGALRRVNCPCIRLAVQLCRDMPDLVSDDSDSDDSDSDDFDSDEGPPPLDRVSDDDDVLESYGLATPASRTYVRRALAPEFDRIAAREDAEGTQPWQRLAGDPRFKRVFAPLRCAQQRLVADMMQPLVPRERVKYLAAIEELVGTSKKAEPQLDPVSSTTTSGGYVLRYNRASRIAILAGFTFWVPKRKPDATAEEDAPRINGGCASIEFSFRGVSNQELLHGRGGSAVAAFRQELAVWFVDLYEAGAFE